MLLGAALVLAMLPAGAQAASLTEFDIEAGAPANTHRPGRIHAGPGNTLWYADQGTAPGVGRSSVFGERLATYGDGALIPVDVLPSAALASYGTSLATVGPATSTPVTGAFGGGGLVLDASGETVYAYGSSITGAVCKLPAACGSTAGVTTGPGELILGPDARVWAVVPGSDAVVSYATSAGAAPTDGRRVELPQGSYPTSLTAGADGNVWVVSLTADRVDRITPAGVRTPFAVPAGTTPTGIVSGPDGALWITGSGNGTVLRMTTAGQVTATFTTSSARTGPSGITVGPDGAIWFTEALAGRLGRIVLDPGSSGAQGGGSGGGSGGSGGGSGSGSDGTIRDTAKPRFLRAPSFTPSRVRRQRSAKLVVVLSEPATLAVVLGRKTMGRRVGSSCVRTTARNRARARCTRYPAAKRVRSAGTSGANAIAVGLRGLPRGSYRATVVATDPAGNASAAAHAALTLARGR